MITIWYENITCSGSLCFICRLKPLLGHYRLQKLDRITYQKVFIDILEQNLKPGTVNLFHSIFKIAINATVEEELLIRNRFTKIVLKNEFELTKKSTTI